MRFSWQAEYGPLAREFIRIHFGNAQGVTRVFSCMRLKYKWGDHRSDVPDPRVPIKNNTEYHGLERHAQQYHATAQYEYAYHHWLLAAAWRKEDMQVHGFTDMGHRKAIEYCIKNALFNRALHEHGVGFCKSGLPQPRDFDLTEEELDKMDRRALKQLEDYSPSSDF